LLGLEAMDLSVVDTEPECNWNIQVQQTRPYYGSTVVRCLYPLLRNVAIQRTLYRGSDSKSTVLTFCASMIDI
jgi:hypothetical protein